VTRRVAILVALAAHLLATPEVAAEEYARETRVQYIARVLDAIRTVERSRLHALERDPRRVRELARAWISPRSPGDHNQALMELGAMVCTPRSPLCNRCPLASFCDGRADPTRFPAPRRRPPVREERLAVALVTRGGKVQLRRGEGDGLLAGMWELPPARPRGEPLAVVRHSVLDRRQLISVYRGRVRRDGRFFAPDELARIPLAAAARKCVERLGILS